MPVPQLLVYFRNAGYEVHEVPRTKTDEQETFDLAAVAAEYQKEKEQHVAKASRDLWGDSSSG